MNNTTHQASLILQDLALAAKQPDGAGEARKGAVEAKCGSDEEEDPLETTVNLLYQGVGRTSDVSEADTEVVSAQQIAKGGNVWHPREKARKQGRTQWSNTLAGPLRRAMPLVNDNHSKTFSISCIASRKEKNGSIEINNTKQKTNVSKLARRKSRPKVSEYKPPTRANEIEARRLQNMRVNLRHDPLESTIDMLYNTKPPEPPQSSGALALPPPTAVFTNGSTARRIVCMDSKSVSEFVKSANEELSDRDAAHIVHFALIKDHMSPPERRINVSLLVPFLHRLQTLHTLVLRRLKFTELPSELAALAPTLRTLDAAHNSLRVWPSAVSSLTKLETLDLSHNNLDVPPEFCCGALSNLRVFKLSANSLVRCPSEIETFLYHNLEELYLDRNEMQVIPVAIGTKFEKLNTFTCFDNPFISERDRAIAKLGVAAIQKALKTRVAKLDQKNVIAQEKENRVSRRASIKSREKRLSQKIRDAPVVGGRSNKEISGDDELRTVARIKRGKLTRCWDLRPYGPDARLPAILFSNVSGIQEALVSISQLPFLIQDESPSAQVDLSSMWRLLYGMKELSILWLFPDAKSTLRGEHMEELSAISRQLSLVFNIANQCPASRRGEPAWRLTVYSRLPSVPL